jgi:hypothetical protein
MPELAEESTPPPRSSSRRSFSRGSPPSGKRPWSTSRTPPRKPSCAVWPEQPEGLRANLRAVVADIRYLQGSSQSGRPEINYKSPQEVWFLRVETSLAEPLLAGSCRHRAWRFRRPGQISTFLIAQDLNDLPFEM